MTDSVPNDLQEPNREIAPTPLQRNISEDERFKNLTAEIGEPDSRDTQMAALDRFREQHPEDYATYETTSIWYDEQGVPDSRQDLFYKKLDDDWFAQRNEKLLAIESDNPDPDARLTAMGQAHERVHFETARDLFSDYKARFPEKSQIYAATGLVYNANTVNFDEYATERLQKIPEKYSPLTLAFYKALVANDLGERAPRFDRVKLGKEFNAAFAESVGFRTEEEETDWKKKARKFLESIFWLN